MSKTFAANEILLRQIELEDLGAVQPDTAGFAAPIGSLGVEHGVYPATATDLWLKSLAGDTGWLKQNLTGVRTFNVRDPVYGAVGDGITDDLIPINLAITACMAAGGGIVYFPPGTYKVTKGTFFPVQNDYGSFVLDNAHNITFMGDGAASKIAAIDDTAGLTWYVFRARNGSTNISFTDLNFDSTGMINPGSSSSSISMFSLAADAIAGCSGLRVSNCQLGPAKVCALTCIGEDTSHTVTNISITTCSLDHSQSNGGNGAQTCIALLKVCDHTLVRHCFGVSGPSGGVGNIVALNNNAVSIPDSIWDWRVDGNHFERKDIPASNTNLVISGGASQSHNTVTSAVANLNVSTNLRHRIVRGNVVVLTDANAQSVIGASNAGGSNQEVSARGNVAVRTVYTAASPNGVTFSFAATAAGVVGQMSDNIAEGGGTTGMTLISLGIAGGAVNISAVMSGNISISNASALGGGGGVLISTQTTADSPVAASVTGNLIVVAAGNALGPGVYCHALAGHNNQLTDVRFNFAAGTQRAADVSTGTKLNWIQVLMNQVTPANAASPEVNPPAASAGYTAGANAGASPQFMASGNTIAGNVQAKKGSLGFNTAGAQGTTFVYKETDDGTPIGGANGWFGVAGYEVSFGVTGGSTTATALFYGGGMGLATPIATEIQYPMPRPGLLRSLRIRCTAGTGGGTVTHTVRKNGVNTALTIGMLNTATNVSDTTDQFTVVKGDLISMRVTKTGTITTGQTLTRSVMELAS